MRNEELIVKHIHYAQQIAFNYANALSMQFCQDEMQSEAVFALVRAGSRYDSTGGVPFHCFVRLRIKGALNDWLRSRTARTGFTPANREKLDPPMERCVFEDIPPIEGKETYLLTGRKLIADALAAIPPRSRLILLMIYADGYLQREVAESLKLTQSRIAQIKRRAFAELRGELERRGIRKVADIL